VRRRGRRDRDRGDVVAGEDRREVGGRLGDFEPLGAAAGAVGVASDEGQDVEPRGAQRGDVDSGSEPGPDDRGAGAAQ